MSKGYEYAIGYLIEDKDGDFELYPKYRANSEEEALKDCENSEDGFFPMRKEITKWEIVDAKD